MKIVKKMLLWMLGIGAIIFLSTFVLIRKNLGYSTQNGVVIYRYVDGLTWKKKYHSLEDADAKSFESFGFNGSYGKDKNHVYLKEKRIVHADPNTFKILEDKYAKDKDYLFAGTKKIGNISDGYEYLGNGFAKNNLHAFKQGRLIKGADGKTFELIDEKGNFARDHQSVFSFGSIIEGSDGPTFRHIEHNFYADKNNVYHGSKKIENASPSSLKVLGNRYARSGGLVFYQTKIIEGADANSFEVIESSDGKFYAQDKNNKYWYDKKVDKFPT